MKLILRMHHFNRPLFRLPYVAFGSLAVAARVGSGRSKCALASIEFTLPHRLATDVPHWPAAQSVDRRHDRHRFGIAQCVLPQSVNVPRA